MLEVYCVTSQEPGIASLLDLKLLQLYDDRPPRHGIARDGYRDLTCYGILQEDRGTGIFLS